MSDRNFILFIAAMITIPLGILFIMAGSFLGIVVIILGFLFLFIMGKNVEKDRKQKIVDKLKGKS